MDTQTDNRHLSVNLNEKRLKEDIAALHEDVKDFY